MTGTRTISTSSECLVSQRYLDGIVEDGLVAVVDIRVVPVHDVTLRIAWIAEGLVLQSHQSPERKDTKRMFHSHVRASGSSSSLTSELQILKQMMIQDADR